MRNPAMSSKNAVKKVKKFSFRPDTMLQAKNALQVSDV